MTGNVGGVANELSQSNGSSAPARSTACGPYDTQGETEPREECGVFGVWAPGEDVSKLSYYGLYALQHRGQEAAGIAVGNGDQIVVFKDLGLVSQVFDEQSLESLKGHIALGHTRYSTAGGASWENAQPMFRMAPNGTDIALGHNGNLVNHQELTLEAARLGLVDPKTHPSDSDVMCALLASAVRDDHGVEDAAVDCLPEFVVRFVPYSLMVRRSMRCEIHTGCARYLLAGSPMGAG